MIIENGTLQIKLKTGGGLDENGNPVRPSESWSPAIPCNIETNQYNGKGTVNGNVFTVASFTILIEDRPFDADRVLLTREGKSLGEFAVKAVIPLSEVGILKITV